MELATWPSLGAVLIGILLGVIYTYRYFSTRRLLRWFKSWNKDFTPVKGDKFFKDALVGLYAFQVQRQEKAWEYLSAFNNGKKTGLKTLAKNQGEYLNAHELKEKLARLHRWAGGKNILVNSSHLLSSRAEKIQLRVVQTRRSASA